jgi:hypothetical protein
VCDTTTTVAAELSEARIARVRAPLNDARLAGCVPKRLFGDCGGEHKGAASNPLTIGAVAGVDHERRSGHLIAKRATLASAADWKFDSCRHGVRCPLDKDSVQTRTEARLQVYGVRELLRNVFLQFPDALYGLNQVIANKCAEIALGLGHREIF